MDHEQKRLELISRFVIFLPIIVVLLAFVANSSSDKKLSLAEQITPTIVSQQSIVNKKISGSKKIELNLNGPYHCVYKDNSIDADISIKNKNLYATYKSKDVTSTIVVKGDCAYMWKQGAVTGEKMCGIGQYISMFEMLSSWNIMSFDSLSSMIGEVQPGMTIDSSVMSNIANSCKKQEITDTIFVVPTGITFTDMKSISPTGM